MSKQFNNFLLKVLILSAFIVVSFNIGDNLINANSNKEKIQSENTTSFKKLNTKNSSNLGRTGVAITTNLGIRYKERKELPVTIYKNVFSVSEIIGTSSQTAKKELIGKNMVSIEEYRNVLKTNVGQLINSNYDKSRILQAFIEQLEYRYVIASENIKNLNRQKTIFINSMNSANSKIETLKQKIENDFKGNNSEESLKNIDSYLELKKQYYYARTYIIYINHFLSEYAYLNNYNKQLLDTLINNKDALVKDAFIVIPDSGAQLLRNFNLIYDEKDFKNR